MRNGMEWKDEDDDSGEKSIARYDVGFIAYYMWYNNITNNR